MNPVDTSDGSAAASPPPLRRVQNPRLIIGFGAVTALMITAAFIGGSLVRSPQDQALTNVDTEVEVLASVEERVVSDSFSLPAVAVAGATVDVLVDEAPQEAGATPPSSGPAATAADGAPVAAPAAPAANPETERAVVSSMALSVGTTLGYGSLIGEVSGRPVFAWPSTVPLFRDLVVGSRGSDVRAIQQTLLDLGYDVNVDGEFGDESLVALRAMYRDHGYELPFVTAGTRGLAWRELVAVPSGDGVVEYTAPLGSALSAEAPLLRLRTTAPALETQATSVEVEQLAAGAEVGIVVGGASPVKSAVASVGGFATNEDTGASGYPVRIAIPDGVAIDASTPVEIRPWAQPAPTTAVPTASVRQEGSTSFVLVSPGESAPDDPEDFERVDVVVIAQAEGWVAIETDDKVRPGTEVLVSP